MEEVIHRQTHTEDERDMGVPLTQELSVDVMLFLPQMEKSYPDEFELMRITGVHPVGDGEPPVNLYTGEKMNEPLDNIGRHNVAVAVAAGIIAEELNMKGDGKEEIGVEDIVTNALLEDVNKSLELMREREAVGALGFGVLNYDEVFTIVAAALRHDTSKALEIMRKLAYETERLKVGAVYDPDAYANVEQVLINHGIDTELARKIKEAGKETGHNSLSSFVELDEDGELRLRDGDYARKIVHLADDMTATTAPGDGEEEKTRYLTPLERMEAQNFRKRYPWMYTEGFGFDREGNVVRVNDVESVPDGVIHAHTFAQWQDWVGRQICAEFKKIIDPNDLAEPGIWMKRFINDMVMLKQAKLERGMS